MRPFYAFFLLMCSTQFLYGANPLQIAKGIENRFASAEPNNWGGETYKSVGLCLHPKLRWVLVFGGTNTMPEFWESVLSDDQPLSFESALSRMPKNRKGRNALNGVFSPDGEHLYLTGTAGLEVLAIGEGSEWKAVQLTGDLFDPKNPPQRFNKIRFTPDGRMAIALRWEKSTYFVEVYVRDPDSGVLTVRQAFQPDAKGREILQTNAPPGAVVTIPGATSLAHFIWPTEVLVSPDGNHVFVLDMMSSVFIFRVDSKEKTLRFVRRLHEPNPSFDTMGLAYPRCAVLRPDARAQANDLFVASTRRLAWFNWDAPQEELTPYRWWIDRAERDRLKQQKKDTFSSFMLDCTSMAVSKNGRYLFLTTGGAPSPVVLEINDGDLKYAGLVDPGPQPADGSRVRNLNLALSPDGKYLLSQSTHCRLKVHALDERYWK